MKYNIKLAAIMTSIGCGTMTDRINYSLEALERAEQKNNEFRQERETYLKSLDPLRMTQKEHDAFTTIKSLHKELLAKPTKTQQDNDKLIAFKKLLDAFRERKLTTIEKLAVITFRAATSYYCNLEEKSSISAHTQILLSLTEYIIDKDVYCEEILNKTSKEWIERQTKMLNELQISKEWRDYFQYEISQNKHNVDIKIKVIMLEFLQNAFTEEELKEQYSMLRSGHLSRELEDAFILYFASLVFIDYLRAEEIFYPFNPNHPDLDKQEAKDSIFTNPDAFDFLLNELREKLKSLIDAKKTILQLIESSYAEMQKKRRAM